MRWKSVLSEAYFNLISAPSRTISTCLLLCAIAISLMLFDVLTVRNLVNEGDRYRAAGASIETVAYESGIDGAACERLAGITGITNAGAMRPFEPGIVARAMPGTTIPAFEVSPHFVEFLSDSLANDGILISRTVAERLGVATGDSIVMTSGVTRVAAVYDWPDDGRKPGLGFAVLLPADAGVFDECWAETWPESPQISGLLTSTVHPTESNVSPKLSALNNTLGTSFHGAEAFEDRLSRFAPLFAAALGAASIAWTVNVRRLEFASAHHLGVRSTDVFRMTACETIALVLPVLLVSIPIAACAATIDGVGNSELLLLGLKTPLALCVGATLATSSVFAHMQQTSFYKSFMRR